MGDELQGAESPGVPECVTAMRQAKIKKQLEGYAEGLVPYAALSHYPGVRVARASGGANARHRAPSGSLDELDEDAVEDPSDNEEVPAALQRGHRGTEERDFERRIRQGIPMRTLQPISHEE